MSKPEVKSEHPQTQAFLKGIFVPQMPNAIRPISKPDLARFYQPEQYALPDIRSQLENLLNGVINLPDETVVRLIDPPEAIDADLAFPCFILAKHLRRSPEQIAQGLADAFSSKVTLDDVKSVEKIGGYVNFKLNENEIGIKVINDVEKLGDEYGNQNIGQGKVVVIDSSSPNIAKFMSVGHLRSTVIGESLARIYAANGYTVIRDNHLGDWGTQFGMLGRAVELWGDQVPESTGNNDAVQGLYHLYVRMHEEIEREKAVNTDSRLEKEGKEWFKRLELGDPQAKELLDWATSQSLNEFQRVYDLLGAKFEHIVGESFYIPMISSMINRLQELNIVTSDETGAISVDLTELKLPRLIIQKSDSTSLYSTRDLATLAARTAWFNPEKIIYVVGGEQKDYFRQVFETFKQWAGDEAPVLEHVSFGMVTLPEGKMSTRKGRVIFLEDVLKEAISRAYDRCSKSNVEMSEHEKNSLAKIIGVGAVIYLDLGQGRDRNIKFNWDQALAVEGQSAPYIQYAYARTEAILAKAHETWPFQYNSEMKITTANEAKLIKLIASFPDAIRRAQEQNQPSIVAEHVYILADAFNHFYKMDQVLKASDPLIKSSRLRLTSAVGQTLKNGLKLLGIESPRRM